jgi:hypothetical protein
MPPNEHGLGVASVTCGERKSNGVHKNDTSSASFSQNRHKVSTPGVHKNKTPGKRQTDTLAQG